MTDTNHPTNPHHVALLISTKQAQALLSLGRTKTEELIKAGELDPIVRIGRRRAITMAALTAFIERHTASGKGK